MALLIRPSARMPFLLILAALLSVTGAFLLPAQSPLERPIKAAFLYNLVKFVEWPAPADRGPIILGILGKDAFGATLKQVVQGRDVDGRPLSVRYISRPEDLRSCHVLFIAESEKDRLAEILDALKGTKALTVSEIEHFAQRGGMIHLLMENQKVRFEVNVDTVSRAGLKISARFLQLASVVRERNRDGGR